MVRADSPRYAEFGRVSATPRRAVDYDYAASRGLLGGDVDLDTSFLVQLHPRILADAVLLAIVRDEEPLFQIVQRQRPEGAGGWQLIPLAVPPASRANRRRSMLRPCHHTLLR